MVNGLIREGFDPDSLRAWPDEFLRKVAPLAAETHIPSQQVDQPKSIYGFTVEEIAEDVTRTKRAPFTQLAEGE